MTITVTTGILSRATTTAGEAALGDESQFLAALSAATAGPEPERAPRPDSTERAGRGDRPERSEDRPERTTNRRARVTRPRSEGPERSSPRPTDQAAEPVRSEPVRSEPVRSEPVRGATGEAASTSPTEVAADQTRAEPVRPESAPAPDPAAALAATTASVAEAVAAVVAGRGNTAGPPPDAAAAAQPAAAEVPVLSSPGTAGPAVSPPTTEPVEFPGRPLTGPESTQTPSSDGAAALPGTGLPGATVLPGGPTGAGQGAPGTVGASAMASASGGPTTAAEGPVVPSPVPVASTTETPAPPLPGSTTPASGAPGSAVQGSAVQGSAVQGSAVQGSVVENRIPTPLELRARFAGRAWASAEAQTATGQGADPMPTTPSSTEALSAGIDRSVFAASGVAANGIVGARDAPGAGPTATTGPFPAPAAPVPGQGTVPATPGGGSPAARGQATEAVTATTGPATLSGWGQPTVATPLGPVQTPTGTAPTPAAVPTTVADQVAGHLSGMRTLRDGTHRTVLQLAPDTLGAVTLTVEVHAGAVRLGVTGSETALAALRDGLNGLRDQLADSGLELADVTLRADTTDAGRGGNERPAPDSPFADPKDRERGRSQDRSAPAPGHHRTTSVPAPGAATLASATGSTGAGPLDVRI